MHKHHEVFEAAARGEASEFEARHREWADFECAENLLTSIYTYPDQWTVRRKQKTHVVNGWEVPAPMTEAPEFGDTCWVESAELVEWCYAMCWSNSRTGLVCLARGICHATEQGAVQNCKSRHGVDPFAEGEES